MIRISFLNVMLLAICTPLTGGSTLCAADIRVGEAWANSRAYRIDSNASAEEVRELATVLDATFNDFSRRFGSAVRISERLTVRLHADRSSFEAYGKQYCNNFASSWRGYYLYADETDGREMVLSVSDDDNHLETAIHEGFHQFLHAGIPNLLHLPQWFNEGIAEYVELATISRRGRLEFPEQLSYQWIDELRTFHAEGRLVPLADLFHVTLKTWNGPNLERNYATAYAFVHYLIEADRAGRRHLVALMGGLASGMAYQDALAQTFGRMNMADTEADFHAWLVDKMAAYQADEDTE